MSDLRTDLIALLDRAAGDGLQVVSIASIRRLLTTTATPLPAMHEIAFDSRGWELHHPATCKTPDCSLAAVARRQLNGGPYKAGRHQVRLGPSGGLSFTPVARSTSDGGG